MARRARSACTHSGVGYIQSHWTVYWVSVSGSVPTFWRPRVRTGISLSPDGQGHRVPPILGGPNQRLTGRRGIGGTMKDLFGEFLTSLTTVWEHIATRRRVSGIFSMRLPRDFDEFLGRFPKKEEILHK